jgi:hypothetical protein
MDHVGVLEHGLLEHADQRGAQAGRGRLRQVMRCQLTSASASTATTLSAFGSSAAAQRPWSDRTRPSGLSA